MAFQKLNPRDYPALPLLVIRIDGESRFSDLCQCCKSLFNWWAMIEFEIEALETVITKKKLLNK